MTFWRHPIYDALGVGNHLNDLKWEFYSKDGRERRKWRRKCLERVAVVWLTGQKLFYKKRFPNGPLKVLYYHHCNAIGDPIMDLSQRFALPDDVILDVCYPQGVACELFANDPKIRQVYSDPTSCPEDYDAILLYDISPQSLRFKLSRYFFKPWSSILDHQQGESYARMPFMAIKLERLFGLKIDPLFYPQLFFPGSGEQIANQGLIAIALGGGDTRRTYEDWPKVLELLVAKCTDAGFPIRFLLIGNGETAHIAANKFSPEFIKAHCKLAIDLPNLTDVVTSIGSAEFFIGCNGGLMHIAQALRKPGIALFGAIKPEWRLHPDSHLQPLWAKDNVNSLTPAMIADKTMSILHAHSSAINGSHH